MSEQVAIIRNPRYGVLDYGVALTFDTYTSENSAALQVLDVEQATDVLNEAGVRDVHDLEGKPCFVDVDGMVITFLRVWKPRP